MRKILPGTSYILSRFYPFILLIPLWLFTIRVIFPGNPLMDKLKLQFESYIKNTPQEKIYLHIDKLQTTLGETVWFKVYLADARRHIEDAASTLVYVDLIDPENRILDSKQLSTTQDMATGDFLIPPDSMPGNYTIRAYTNYMRNFDESFFYRQQIQVGDITSDNSEVVNQSSTLSDNTVELQDTIHVDFFPEGGDLVNGINSKVAFKISASHGKNKEAKLKIIDQEGKLVTQVAAINEGMGLFNLRPEPGRSYSGEFEKNGIVSRFPLPQALKEGYVLGVSQKPNGNPTIIMQTNIKNGLSGSFVIGQMMGQICFTIEGKPNVSEMTAQIPIAELPDGVCQFTLFNPLGEPVCERLIFIQNQQNKIHVDLRTDASEYKSRQKVNIELDIQNLKAERLPANLSCSVVDFTAIGDDEIENNIQTYFLLKSDLPNLIEQPDYFQDSMDTRHRILLDLILMTQGWRRFVWKALPVADVQPKWNYLPERGFTISGNTLRNENSAKPVIAEVFLSAMGNDGFSMLDQVTADDGGFYFADMNFDDTTKIVLQANIYNPKKNSKKPEKENLNESKNIGPSGNRYVSIILNKTLPPENKLFQPMILPATFPDEYLEDRRNVNRIDSTFSGLSINLKEVLVKGRKTVKPRKEPFRSVYGNPTNRVILDSLPELTRYISLFDVLRGRFPGVQVHRSFTEQFATIRGPRSLEGDNIAQVFLDGLAISNDQAAGINVEDIAAIDIFRGTAASLFGARGANGAILVHTRIRTGVNKTYNENYPGVIKFKHPGYYKAREFYSPDYSASISEHQKPDFRSTLYWNPYISQDKTGKHVFSFYTCDKKSDYRIIVEGITGDGRLIHKETTIKVL